MRKLLFSLMAVALVFGVYGGVAYGKKPAKDTNYIDKLTEEFSRSTSNEEHGSIRKGS